MRNWLEHCSEKPLVWVALYNETLVCCCRTYHAVVRIMLLFRNEKGIYLRVHKQNTRHWHENVKTLNWTQIETCAMCDISSYSKYNIHDSQWNEFNLCIYLWCHWILLILQHEAHTSADFFSLLFKRMKMHTWTWTLKSAVETIFTITVRIDASSDAFSCCFFLNWLDSK